MQKFFLELPAADQEQMRGAVERTTQMLKACEARLQSYISERPAPEVYDSGIVFKVLSDMFSTSMLLVELRKEMSSRHNLPDIYAHPDDEDRNEYRGVLFGIPME